MGLKITGDDEMIAAIEELNFGVQKRAKKALVDGAEAYEKVLKAKTPEYVAGPNADNVHAADDVTHSSVSQTTGDLSVDVGYGPKSANYIRFPNWGTTKQDPQHFMEAAQEEATTPVLEAFLKNLKVGE
ncbi:HK97-gp10 family putative phage morphogenesis protein [Schleiferilactobacillus perolens]|nr:HK97-gp10 family putative phage morphogenesis protein [Schleiferilactobacillus perolens]